MEIHFYLVNSSLIFSSSVTAQTIFIHSLGSYISVSAVAWLFLAGSQSLDGPPPPVVAWVILAGFTVIMGTVMKQCKMEAST